MVAFVSLFRTVDLLSALAAMASPLWSEKEMLHKSLPADASNEVERYIRRQLAFRVPVCKREMLRLANIEDTPRMREKVRLPLANGCLTPRFTSRWLPSVRAFRR